jgi:hypothetical protein
MVFKARRRPKPHWMSRKSNYKGMVYHHGTCRVNHRTMAAAENCRKKNPRR